MGEMIDKILAISPIGAILIIVIVIFIRHIDRRDISHKAEMDEHRAMLKGIHDSCHTFQTNLQTEQNIMSKSLENALDHNTRELQRNTNFLAKVTKVNGDD